MNHFAKTTRIFSIAFALGVMLLGCGQQSSFEVIAETDDPVYRRAKDLYARGMENEALENFLKLIQKRHGEAAESHLEAGNIYLNHLRDPETAIYYFKRYKALISRSGSSDASLKINLVEDLIKTARKEFARTYDVDVFQDPLERLKLLDTIERLHRENDELKQQLSNARARLKTLSSQSIPLNPPARIETEARPEYTRPSIEEIPREQINTYVIKSGDSLFKIARQFYGDPNRWRDILDANRDVISDESNLKVGTRIVLP